MLPRHPLAITFLAVLVAAAGGADPATSHGSPSSQHPTAEAPAEPEGTGAEVAITRFVFAPFSIEIRVGEAVTWTNHDAAGHTATADTFDTGHLAQGESSTIFFAEAGELFYTCRYHANMAGRIVVTP